MAVTNPDGPDSRASVLAASWPALALFLPAACLLAATRVPWTAEGWTAGWGVSLLRDGRVADFGRFLPPDAPGPALVEGEAFGALAAAWMYVFGLGLVTTRLLSVVTGAGALVAICAALLRGGASRAATRAAGALVALSYFVLLATTQVRPDAPALLCAAAAIWCATVWAEHGGAGRLGAAHALAIAGTWFHLQAGFALAALWVVSLGLARRPTRRDLAAALLPYVVAAGAFGVVHGSHALDDLGRLAGFTSTQLDRRWGGIPRTILRWAADGRWHHAAAGVGLVAGTLAGPLVFWRDRRTPAARALVLLALGAWASWFVTTHTGNDRHAVWLAPALALAVAAAWNREGAFARRRLWLLAVPAGLAVVGVGFVVQETVRNERVTVYAAEMDALDRELGLSRGTFICTHDVLWHFGFDAAVFQPFTADRPAPWFVRAVPQPDEPAVLEMRGHRYELAHRLERFAAYRHVPR